MFIFKKESFHIILLIFTIIKSLTLGVVFFSVYKANSGISFCKFILIIFLFVFLAEIINIFIVKGMSAISINTAVKDLEKEKELKLSLFKITHEVKNPLAVCKGYLSMMDFSDEKKVSKYLSIVQNEIGRTLDILDNFSEYTKINIKKERMDLVLLINDTFNDLRELCFNKNIEFINNVKLKSAYINGDYSRLKQVIVNLIKNSIESINGEGKISVNLTLSKYKYLIIIKDNGKGMDKETLDKLGEMFFTTKDNGTGIGVGLCKEIIKQHNGTITYSSSLGSGTEVKIELKKM